MKVNKKQADFTPIDLTVTIESQQELSTLIVESELAFSLLHNSTLHTISALVIDIRDSLLRGEDND